MVSVLLLIGAIALQQQSCRCQLPTSAFHGTDKYETVHFDSHDISKPYSSSELTALDEEDAKTADIAITPEKERLDRIVKVIRGELGLNLMGIDVIIENETGRYAIIDMNSFPGRMIN